MRRRTALAAGAMLATAARLARAEDRRSYAVVSLIGDAIEVVVYELSVGSNLDRNRRGSVPIPDAIFDRTALQVAAEALKAADAGAPVALFMPRTPELFQRHQTLFDGGKATLPPALSGELAAQGITHLLLFTKHRTDARLLDAHNEPMGSGKLEGLGFYVDRARHMRSVRTGASYIGFLAAYAYVRASLIDLRTSAVLGSRSLTADWMTAPDREQDQLHPWDAMSAADKVTTLSTLLQSSLRDALPAVLQRP